MDSLVNQTYQNFNIICVDDRSPDKSALILESYRDFFGERLVIIHNKENLGLSLARNVGLDCPLADGEYILLLDSDDYIEDDYLEKMVNCADTYHTDITICGLDRFDDMTGKVVCREMISNTEQVVDDIPGFKDLAYMNPVVWNKLFRRDVIKNIRFTTIKRSEDTVFLFLTLPNVRRIKFINEVLYHYRLRENSLSGAITDEIYESMLDGFEETVKRLEKEPEKYALIKELFEVQIFIRCGLGGTCRLSFRNMKNAGYYIRRTKKFLDRAIPNWKRNSYLSVKGLFHRSVKQNAVMAAALLYKWNLFILFIWVYWFMTNIIKKDIRW